jgi:DNA repair exonuclease SbcCD nuclease subunit
MKLLAIGDQHFKLDNIVQVELFISKLALHLSREKYDVIVSGGDLLDTHERLHTQCLNKAIEYLKLLSSHTKTYVLVGNHDMINPSQYLTTNHWLNVVKEWDKKYDITVVDTPVIHKDDEYSVVLCPYVPDGMFCRALDTLNTDEFNWKNANLVFGHQTMDGVKMGSITAENVEEWKAEYPTMISFHVHDMQTVKSNLFYTGSCMQHSFGESVKKYLWKINMNKENEEEDDSIYFFNKVGDMNIVVDKVELGVPKRKIINCTTKELEEMKSIDDIIPRIYRNDMYILKIVVSGSSFDFKNLRKKEYLKPIFSKYKVIFKQTIQSTIDKEDLLKEGIEDVSCSFENIFVDILKKEIDQEMYNYFTSL